jgi:hypothetical protein
MVDPCFVTVDRVVQKGVTLLMILAQKVVTDVQMVLPVLFYELFWNGFCTNFMEVKSVMDDFIDRTLTDLQLFCHFINSHPSVVESQ